MENCIFCKIISGNIPSDIIYRDNKVIVFKDLNPQAPIHLLIVPIEHIKSAKEINEHNADIIGHVFNVANKLPKDIDLEKGYRIVNNCDSFGGQTVDHIHFHLLAGRQMLWPPG